MLLGQLVNNMDWKLGNINLIKGIYLDSKVCPKCKEKKLISEFHKDKSKSSGLHSWCKICKNKSTKAYTKAWHKKNPTKMKTYQKDYYLKNTEKIKQRSRKWAKDNPGRRRQIEAASGRGMSVFERELFLEQRDFRCEICGISRQTSIEVLGRDLCIDHCHKTRALSGVLCSLCNTASGRLKDNPDLAYKLWKYLERTRKNS